MYLLKDDFLCICVRTLKVNTATVYVELIHSVHVQAHFVCVKCTALCCDHVSGDVCKNTNFETPALTMPVQYHFHSHKVYSMDIHISTIHTIQNSLRTQGC